MITLPLQSTNPPVHQPPCASDLGISITPLTPNP